MTRATLAAVAVGLASCAAPSAPGLPERDAERPNVIVIVTDDQRADALSAAGNAVIETPALDALAADGTRFTNGYVTTSICAVSRASILSGQYARRHGVTDFATGFSAEQIRDTYLARFEAAGYVTGFVGKWGLGGALPDTLVDVWHGFGGQGSYAATDADGESVHLTRLLERQAVGFLREAAAQRAPFHLSISFKAPHVEDPNRFPSDPAFDALYAGVPIPPPADTAYVRTESLPAFGFADNAREEGRARWRVRFATDSLRQENVRRYYRLVAGVDRAVAAIRAELERLGVAERTVVVFTSDNGFFLGEHGLAGKWYGHQESVRVPLLIFDPRSPASGQVRDEIALNIDVAPTVLDLAGLAVPAGMQGQSLRPLVWGEAVPWRTEFFYEHLFGYDGRIPRTEGVIGERFSYLRYVDPEPAVETLFDHAVDPTESVDWTRHLDARPALADTLAALRQRWARYRDALR
ncbi:sulfatase [Rubrivirga sp.]|uniref:sulfatase family protein n=1 Tax=Rubrivirga sp. TaxID=1885344 RepID=UPI003B530574